MDGKYEAGPLTLSCVAMSVPFSRWWLKCEGSGPPVPTTNAGRAFRQPAAGNFPKAQRLNYALRNGHPMKRTPPPDDTLPAPQDPELLRRLLRAKDRMDAASH